MNTENCSKCGETWVISDCRKIYYIPSDPLHYFIREKEKESDGCPKCDCVKWTYKMYESIF